MKVITHGSISTVNKEKSWPYEEVSVLSTLNIKNQVVHSRNKRGRPLGKVYGKREGNRTEIKVQRIEEKHKGV